MMTLEELQSSIPVHKHATGRYVRVRDIPNPYRSEFSADSLLAECPAIPGEGLCHFVGDWAAWLSFRFKPDYQLRYGAASYREITDAELDASVR
ncbi:hypothetical protein PQR71_35280 [Paraburkholderia fungorum]|uniref:hypothetical protein n=1 Tax=Paraburkholderia fungorum TaxID=134537 RepID=UPI0038BA0F6A